MFIKQTYNLPIKQYVIYIGSAPSKMKNRFEFEELSYKYSLLDMRDVESTLFLDSNNPEEIIMSVLCGHDNPELLVREILQKIRKSVKGELQFTKYIRQLEIISQLRGLENVVYKEEERMAITFDIKKDRRYQQGEKEGEKRGERIGKMIGLLQGIELALEIKFGAEGLEVFQKIQKIDNINKLINITDTIRNADNLSEIETVLD